MDSASAIVLAAALIIIMLGMGLSLVIDDFKRIVKYPKAILVGLVNQLILLPLIGFLLVTVFPVAPEIAIGVIILAVVKNTLCISCLSNSAFTHHQHLIGNTGDHAEIVADKNNRHIASLLQLFNQL